MHRFFFHGIVFIFFCIPACSQNKIEEKSFINLGGEIQYVEITGESTDNPVLLFIHGGPGWPQTPQLRYQNAALTKKFILATWDQRGSGKSFINNPQAKNVSLAQIVTDAHELTVLLKEKFHKNKILLAGFSWGSIVGLALAEKYPQDYAAYIGISQVINIHEGLTVTQNWISKQAKKNNDTATLHILTQLKSNDTTLCKTPLDCFLNQYGLVSKYKGAVFNPASEQEINKAMQEYEDYKNYDWTQGFLYSATRLENDMFSTNFNSVQNIKIPVYLIAGRHDWNVPQVLADAWIKKLDAPHKEIIWFENSGHGPLEEEPKKFNEVLIEKFK